MRFLLIIKTKDTPIGFNHIVCLYLPCSFLFDGLNSQLGLFLTIPTLILSKIRTFSVSHGMLNTGVFIQVPGTSPTIDD